MEYRTIEGVELLTVGMEWHSVNGDQTFTFEHLADAMEAANNDPHIVAPRLKIGHSDPRFNPEGTWHNPFDEPDGAPALGSIKNLRLENEGAVLVGDFVEVPAWLADAIPSAYPNRSIEGAYIDGSWEVETQGGKRYSFVLTGCALLGIFGPAVADLDDLERFLTEGPKEDELTVLTQGDIAKAAVAAGAGATLAADIDKVRGEFWREFATEESGRYWWWPRSIWTDPNEIIADDDEGHLYRVPFSSDEEGNVTFEDPQEVRETFVDIASNEPVAARAGQPAATFTSRAIAGREKEKPAASSQPDPQEETMPKIDMDALRTRLGLPDDATEEQINEALSAEQEGADPAAEGGEGEPSGEGEGAAQELEPVAATVAAERGVTVDKEALAQLQADAAAGREARNAQLSAERSSLLEQAIKDGKFPPAAKAAYREQLDKGGEIEMATRKFIDELPANTVPVTETGEAGGDVVAASAGLPGSWFPELNRNGAAGAKED